MRKSIRLAGFGGQGVITMGYVLANAASIHDGHHALMTQSYGPEARGGSCRSDVIISDESIDYPKSNEIDTLVALSNDSYHSFIGAVKEGGVVIYESDQVDIPGKKPSVEYYGIPALAKATELGNPLVANMIMLGATQAVTKMFDMEALKKSITDRFPRFVDLNLKALEEGFRLGEKVMEESHNPL